MIYIHSYGVGKFGSKQIRNIHDTLEEAQAQQRVLGGVIQAFESVENLALTNEIVLSEISQLIDDLISEELGSPRSINLTDAQWNEYKHNSMKKIMDIMSGNFNEN